MLGRLSLLFRIGYLFQSPVIQEGAEKSWPTLPTSCLRKQKLSWLAGKRRRKKRASRSNKLCREFADNFLYPAFLLTSWSNLQCNVHVGTRAGQLTLKETSSELFSYHKCTLGLRKKEGKSLSHQSTMRRRSKQFFVVPSGTLGLFGQGQTDV